MTVVGRCIEIGTQAHPFDEVGQRISPQHACRLFALFDLPCRRGCELGILVVEGFYELVDDTEEFLDVLDAAARLVGTSFCKAETSPAFSMIISTTLRRSPE